MPVHQILLSTATASVVLAAPAVPTATHHRLAVSVTVVSPCSVSVQGPRPQPTSLEPVTVACASPSQSFVRADGPAKPRSDPQAQNIAIGQEPGEENTTEVVNIIF